MVRMIEFTLSKIGLIFFVAVLLYSLTYVLQVQTNFQKNDLLMKDCSNIKHLIERLCYSEELSIDYKTNSLTNLSISNNWINLSHEELMISRRLNCPISKSIMNSDCYVIRNDGEVRLEKC
ncbi:MAG: hypothetical protein GOU97_01080 [Nanoarchaeota archaeon]|nr:hypothetical protein [Nanoarchaeota archaeon]